MTKYKSLVLLFIQLLAIGFVSADESSEILSFPNESSSVSDPYFGLSPDQPVGLPPAQMLRPELVHAIKVAVKFMDMLDHGDSCSRSKCDVNKLFDGFFASPDQVRIFLVQTVGEMTRYCATGGDKNYSLPTGAVLRKVACTKGNDTYIVAPSFASLSQGDRALIMIHERLTTLRDSVGGRNYLAVDGVVAGLKRAIEIAQAQLNGMHPILSDFDVNLLNHMYISLTELQNITDGIGGNYQWQVTPNGGAKVMGNIRFSGSAYADIWTRLSAGDHVCPRSGCTIGEGTEIQKSNIRFYPGASFIADHQAIANINIDEFSPKYYLESESMNFNPRLNWHWILRDSENVYWDVANKGQSIYQPNPAWIAPYVDDFKTTAVCKVAQRLKGGLFDTHTVTYFTECDVELVATMCADHKLRGIDANGIVQRLGFRREFSESQIESPNLVADNWTEARGTLRSEVDKWYSSNRFWVDGFAMMSHPGLESMESGRELTYQIQYHQK